MATGTAERVASGSPALVPVTVYAFAGDVPALLRALAVYEERQVAARDGASSPALRHHARRELAAVDRLRAGAVHLAAL